MADEGMKDFTVTFIIGGLLMFCLLTFTILFMYNNNTEALGEAEDKLSSNYDSSSDTLISITGDSDSMLNITANTNPETSDLGSRDSVSVAYESKSIAYDNWENSKEIIAYVFSGTSGIVLLSVFGGIIGLLTVFNIWRFIKTGL